MDVVIVNLFFSECPCNPFSYTTNLLKFLFPHFFFAMEILPKKIFPCKWNYWLKMTWVELAF